MRRRGVNAWMPGVLSLCVLSVYALASAHYARVWQDELTVWTYAVQRAPNKPRPHLQLALALMERHRFIEAQFVLDDTDRILRDASPMPRWDRRDAVSALQQNRLLLARAAGLGPTFR